MLTRRGLFILGTSAVASRGAVVRYREYPRCLPDFLAGLARDAYQRRNGDIARLTAADAIRRRQQWVRDTFWKLVGGMPERTPLEPRTTGAFERRGYRVEKMVYQSQPGFHIPANLYLPATGKPPYPGVLFQMGHSLNGKAAEPYQKCCQGLARLGYAVLAFDPMGQGERTYYPEPGGVTTRLDADGEHTVAGRQMLLAGDTATRMQVWDAVRSLDVLATHPLVDPARLASTGQSGGGTITMLLAAVDDRLAAAAVSCGNTENFACADFNPPGSTDDAEQNLIASSPVAFDRWDLLYPLAPKPLLILASARDFFGTYSPRYLANGREEFEKLAGVYAALGARDRLAWDETPSPHALSYFLRTRIYAWFERWLHGGAGGDIAEPPVEPERDETLWVGPTGNTIRDFDGKTPLALTRERVAAIRPAAVDRARIRMLLVLDAAPPAAVTELARVPSEACDIAAIEVTTAPHVAAPAWLYIPRKSDPSRPVLLIIDPRGRSARWGEGGLYQRLAAAGTTVCAADIRGVGDLAPEVGRGSPQYAIGHSSEEAWAWASLILGRPLAGQRVTDLLAFVGALGKLDATRGRRIVLVAEGPLAVPALFATALDARIERAWLGGGLASYRTILDVEDYRQPTANFLPGILSTTDLPQVAALAAPRRITLAGAVDGAGIRMGAERVSTLYSQTPNVEVEERADLASLARL